MFLSDMLLEGTDQDPARAPAQMVGAWDRVDAGPATARELHRCRNAESLRKWFRSFAQSVGFYGGRYLHLGHLPSGGREAAVRPIRFLSTAGNEGADGFSSGWKFDDPSIAIARSAFAPFAWSTRGGAALSDRQRAWMSAERVRGVSAGIAVPIQDYESGPAYLSLFGVDEAHAVGLLAERAAEFAFVGARFHAHAKATLPTADSAANQAALTHREIECLRLAAIGWTVSASATALGIAGRTVEFHLGNAAGKLNAVNKIHAVAIATSKRLIAL